MTFLETDRLLLRTLRESDFEDFCVYANDSEMSRMMGRDDLSDPVLARANFDWLKDREPRGYGLVLKETGRLVGNLTVGKPAEEVSELPEYRGRKGFGLSFCMGRPYQRQGLMTEALNAVIHRLMTAEQADYVNCGSFDFNEPSRRLQEKLGFVEAAYFCFRRGEETFRGWERVLSRDVFLETERLILRPFREADFRDFCAYAMDPEMSRMIGLQDLKDGTAARRAFERMRKRPRDYAIVQKDTGKVIGDLEVGSLPPVLENMEILRGKKGCALSFSLSRHCRRQGLMFELLEGLITTLFREEQMDYVNCGFFDFNEPSRRLQEKLGFACLATHPYRRGSEVVRVIDNIMWKEKWAASHKEAEQ